MSAHRSDLWATARLPRLTRLARTGASRQRGQAIIEYVVVLAFGVIILLKPFSLDDVTTPGAPKDQAPALKQLADAIKNYHKHYTYAMAIASIPECDYTYSYDKSASVADIATLAGSLAVGVDRCFDWQDPKIPAISLDSTSLTLDIQANFKDAIKTAVTSMLKDSLQQFFNPASLLSGFSPIPLP